MNNAIKMLRNLLLLLLLLPLLAVQGSDQHERKVCSIDEVSYPTYWNYFSEWLLIPERLYMFLLSHFSQLH